MNWFEEWFDSPLYEKLYANRDEAEAVRVIEFLNGILELNQCARILDLGCGRGRHAITLSRKGFQVKGTDLSEQAIQTAQSKAEAAGLDNVSFEVRDMRHPLPENFDAIVNLFTTFGYFHTDKENASVFDSVVQMLNPGGVFVLDYLNAHKVRKEYEPEEAGQFHGVEYCIKRYVQDDVIIKDIEFTGDKVNGESSYSERVKLYDLSWFQDEMEKRGLQIDYVYGDYNGGDFNAETSSRLLIISHLAKREE